MEEKKKTARQRKPTLAADNNVLGQLVGAEVKASAQKEHADAPEDQEPTGAEWENFLGFAQEFDRKAKKEGKDYPAIQVWLDADLKNILDGLRDAGIRYPVKHLLSAAVKAFLTNNRETVNKTLSKRPRIKI